MSIFEYDKEEEERKLRKAEFEAGREAGMKAGREAGIKVGKLRKVKELAMSLNKSGFPVRRIAELLQVNEEMILEWLKESEK